MLYSSSVSFVTTSVIILLICVFGLVGNMLCVVVLFNKHMTRTSYTYILQGLTISDTCLLALAFTRTLDNLDVISLSKDEYFLVIVFFWDWISRLGTGYFTVAVSLERLFVIAFPLKAHALLTTKRSQGTACGIFGFCVLLSCLIYIYSNWINPNLSHISAAVFIIIVILPFVLVIVLNVLILIGLRRIKGLAIRKSSTAKKDDDYHVTRMIFSILLVFGIFYSLEFIRRMMRYLWPDYMNLRNYYDYIINILTDVFYVLNSSVNFVLYCLLDKKFRTIFCKIFRIEKGTKSNGDVT